MLMTPLEMSAPGVRLHHPGLPRTETSFRNRFHGVPLVVFLSRVYHGWSFLHTLRAGREGVSQQGGSTPGLATSRIQVRMYGPGALSQ